MKGRYFNKNIFIWLENLLKERLSEDIILILKKQSLYIEIIHHDGKIYFSKYNKYFDEFSSQIPCFYWDCIKDGFDSYNQKKLPVPGIDSIEEKLIEFGKDIIINYDLLGFFYWYLIRLEEIGNDKILDKYNRYCPKQSHAFLHEYFDRPIVDEWFYILRQLIKKKWPNFKLKQTSFKYSLSHDIDRPFRYLSIDFYSFLRRSLGELKTLNFIRFIKSFKIRFSKNEDFESLDPYNTFDWLIEFANNKKIQSTFYFMSGISSRNYDGCYDLNDKRIISILKKIDKQGHLIGIHPSFETYKCKSILENELKKIKYICKRNGISQDIISSRMHYLRWQNPHTLVICDSVGIKYDSTLGFSEHVGFRSGTCFPYQGFDPLKKRILNIRIKPFQIMDAAFINKIKNNNLESNTDYLKCMEIKNQCQFFNGNLDILWHNSELNTKYKIRFFKILFDDGK